MTDCGNGVLGAFLTIHRLSDRKDVGAVKAHLPLITNNFLSSIAHAMICLTCRRHVLVSFLSAPKSNSCSHRISLFSCVGMDLSHQQSGLAEVSELALWF